MEAVRIRDGVWEFKAPGMNVPARIIASDKLYPTIEEGVFKQISNVAKLPGIIEPALVMPDGHFGYGFPIGGVAAFSMDKGVISPGGVGYDINCLHEDARILSNLGYSIPVKELDESSTEAEVQVGDRFLKVKREMMHTVKSLNPGTGKIEDKKILYSMKRKSEWVINITTSCGLKSTATGEHPFLTTMGMKNLKDICEGECVGISLFNGVEYESPSDKVIVDAGGLVASERSIKELIMRNLIPLREDSPQTPYLAKILGYLFGDGCVYFSGGKGYVCAYGSEEDMAALKSDLAHLGYSATIIRRRRDHRIVDQYGVKEFSSENHELHVTSTSLARLLVSLGMPLGKKTSTNYSIPEWVMNSKRWIKRLFLAGFFGAELSSPQTHSKTGFYPPILSQNKNEKFVENGRHFMIQLMTLLEDLGVECTKISVRREHQNKEGKTCRIRLLLSAEEENLLRLWRNIGFEYNKKRQRKAEIAALYILKKKFHTACRALIAERVRRMRKKGLTLKEVQVLLASENANRRFIERHYYSKAGQRIRLDFVSFDEFTEQCMHDYSLNGCLLDTVSRINERRYGEMVYDLTIADNHNFVADGFIVSNCGVRLLASNLQAGDVKNRLPAIADDLFREVPSGLGSESRLRYGASELEEVCLGGARWAAEKGFGAKADLPHIEEGGAIEGADPAAISDKAKKRGRPQLGTLGSGNHFLEVSKVAEIFDKGVAAKFGLTSVDQVTVMVHCGSRGLGYQVADDYIAVMLNAAKKYGIQLPDRELACAPLTSKEADEYVKAMYCAVNYAFANRQFITHWVRDVFHRHFPDSKLDLVYDVCHNIAKFEEHRGEKVCVHRKGATRAFAAGRKEVPQDFRDVGQPVLVPGDMGTASYVLVGTKTAMNESFGSVCHGAGRVQSRSKAKSSARGEDVKKRLEAKGEVIRAASLEVLAEEQPEAYKDVDEVVRSVEIAGLGKLVAKLVPMGVVKG